MKKKIAALAGVSIVVALAGMHPGLAAALPACVAATGAETCEAGTTGDPIAAFGRAEGVEVTIWDAGGQVLQHYIRSYGRPLLDDRQLEITDEIFQTAPGGRAVLSIRGYGVVTLGPPT